MGSRAACRRRGIVLAGVLAGAGLAACTPDFEEPWAVRDLRLLALQAEPPELLYRELPPELLSAGDGAAPVDPIRLRALAADPREPGREVEWEIWACTPEASGCREAERRWPVAIDAAGRCQPLAEDAAPPRQRSRLDAITCDFVPTIASLLASLEADPYRGFGGLPLVVELRLFDGSQLVPAFKRLVYTVPLPYSPVPAAKQANRNPELVAIEIDGARWTRDRLATERPRVGAGAERELLPIVAEGAKESYLVLTTGAAGERAELGGDPPVQELEEALSYEFYATAGELSHGRTGGRGSTFIIDKKVDDLTSRWTAPTPAPSATPTLWIVVRDDRGGSSWLSFSVEVVASAEQ
ncbi:MAG: hypothetical protein IPL40_03285 [Proteobacteria bacterium]|nr:hypothetical protein [Pseudomonadota bacterium]